MEFAEYDTGGVIFFASFWDTVKIISYFILNLMVGLLLLDLHIYLFYSLFFSFLFTTVHACLFVLCI